MIVYVFKCQSMYKNLREKQNKQNNLSLIK